MVRPFQTFGCWENPDNKNQCSAKSAQILPAEPFVILTQEELAKKARKREKNKKYKKQKREKDKAKKLQEKLRKQMKLKVYKHCHQKSIPQKKIH